MSKHIMTIFVNDERILIKQTGMFDCEWTKTDEKTAIELIKNALDAFENMIDEKLPLSDELF